MKKFILLFMFVCIVTSMVLAQGNTYKIIGVLDEKIEDRLMLMGDSKTGLQTLGEVDVKKGRFEFTGTVNEMIPAYIMTADKEMLAMFMLENAEYTLTFGRNGIEIQGGGAGQKIWVEYNNIAKKVYSKQMGIEQQFKTAYASGNQTEMKAIQQRLEKVVAEMRKEQKQLFAKYSDSPITAFIITMEMKQMKYKELSELYNILGSKAKESWYGQAIYKYLEQIK